MKTGIFFRLRTELKQYERKLDHTSALLKPIWEDSWPWASDPTYPYDNVDPVSQE